MYTGKHFTHAQHRPKVIELIEMVYSSSCSATDNGNELPNESLLKKLCVFLCIPQNAYREAHISTHTKWICSASEATRMHLKPPTFTGEASSETGPPRGLGGSVRSSAYVTCHLITSFDYIILSVCHVIWFLKKTWSFVHLLCWAII